MKFPKLSPRGYDLLLDEVLGGLPQGYTFTRDDSGARVRYVVSYEGEALLQYTVGEDATGGGLHFGERSLIAERLIDPRNKTPEERRLLSKAGEVMRRIEEKLRTYTEIILPAVTAHPQGPTLVEVIELDNEVHGLRTPYQVALWLAQYTQEAILQPLKREDGGYFILEPLLLPTLPFTDGQFLEMRGQYHPADGGAAIQAPWLLRFELGIPGTATMRLVARCREATAHGYFQRLISDLRRAWKCRPMDANLWFREAAKELTRAGEVRELLFEGTPYDFGGAVSDFIAQYYSDATAWTGCTFTFQQAEIDPDMPNASVEIECPADGGGLPAFVWVTARRLPGGKSKLVMTTESGDCGRSSQLHKALDGFLEALTRWGWLATPEDAAPAEAEKAAASSTIQAPVLAEKVLELELEAIENDKRYHAQQRARVLLQYTEDPALRARLEAILAMGVSITSRVNNFFQDPFRRVRPHIEATAEAEKTVSPPASVGEEGAIIGGKYGTNRDLSFEDVKAIVARCKAFQERGGKVPSFYDMQNITPGEPRSYELETLRGWLKDPRFC